ncbi:MAG TPA: hypothetical protein VGR57_15365 [Ktedonobacterales bacterium]|nr:hypothetical protein [Ktedonobacterales bacterium]
MRLVAWFARHPRLRVGLVFVVVVVVYGGARWWTSGSDAVHITITHVAGDDGKSPATTSVTYDRTIPNGEVAQRLQRDLAAMPLADYFGTYSCPLGNFIPSGDSLYDSGSTYDAYTLTWFRAGLPIEQASVKRTGCAFWQDDGVFFHVPAGAETMYADIEAVVTAGG